MGAAAHIQECRDPRSNLFTSGCFVKNRTIGGTACNKHVKALKLFIKATKHHYNANIGAGERNYMP